MNNQYGIAIRMLQHKHHATVHISLHFDKDYQAIFVAKSI